MTKVLHVINTLAPEGAQTLLISFLKHINNTNYQNFIAYLYGDGDLLKQGVWDKRIEVFDLTQKGKFSYFSFFRLLKIIRTKKIDIIHTHLVQAGILGKLAAKLTGVKHIVTTRHYGYHDKENTFLYRLEQRLTVSGSVVIAISTAVKDYLIKQGVRRVKIVVIHNSIDLKLFNTDKATNTIQKDDKNLMIGSIGRLHPRKDFDTLLESFQLVIKQMPHVILEIVGDGVLSEELRNNAKRLHISDKVRFIGSIAPQAVVQKLAQWDLFVMSSLWEGFGIAIIEAMAMEKAVVATNVGGIVEIVNNGTTGYLVPPKSPFILAKKIVELLYDEPKRLKMGKSGRAKVVSHFSIEQFVEKTSEVYGSFFPSTHGKA